MLKQWMFFSWLLVAVICWAINAFAEGPLVVGDFAHSDLHDWEEKVFAGTTHYESVEQDGQTVLRAESRNSASGLFRELRVDLQKYPYLNWRWRITGRSGIDNEKIKAGDDYAARVYVVVDGGLFFWKTKAVNYVWADAAHKGEVWPNAFAGKNAMMMALRSGEDDVSTWYVEKRNIREELKKLFGEDIRYIDAVALMTDTDNAGGEAISYYGDIYFSAE